MCSSDLSFTATFGPNVLVRFSTLIMCLCRVQPAVDGTRFARPVKVSGHLDKETRFRSKKFSRAGKGIRSDAPGTEEGCGEVPVALPQRGNGTQPRVERAALNPGSQKPTRFAP